MNIIIPEVKIVPAGAFEIRVFITNTGQVEVKTAVWHDAAKHCRHVLRHGGKIYSASAILLIHASNPHIIFNCATAEVIPS